MTNKADPKLLVAYGTLYLSESKEKSLVSARGITACDSNEAVGQYEKRQVVHIIGKIVAGETMLLAESAYKWRAPKAHQCDEKLTPCFIP